MDHLPESNRTVMIPKARLIEEKVFNVSDREALRKRLNYWKFFNHKVVFTNGCFDILHPGHIDYLSKAADMGQLLVVGLNTDASVARLKGSDRPVNNQKARATMLASLFFVDAVVLFEEDTPYELIKMVQPDILVKGSDYKPEDIVGFDLIQDNNGQVVTIDFLEGYSTTGLISRLKSL